MKTKSDEVERPSHATIKRGHRVTYEEHVEFCKALGVKPLMGRPPLGEKKKVPIALRMDRDVLVKLRAKAAKIGVGYQTLINRWVGERV